MSAWAYFILAETTKNEKFAQFACHVKEDQMPFMCSFMAELGAIDDIQDVRIEPKTPHAAKLVVDIDYNLEEDGPLVTLDSQDEEEEE